MKTDTQGSRIPSKNPRYPRFSVLPTIGLIVVLSAVAALADQLCFNHISAPGAPPNWGQPPLIDGSVINGDTRCFNGGTPPCGPGPDLGWANSFSYVFNNPDGPVTPDVIVEGIRDDTHFYLSVQANNSTPTGGGSSDPTNAVVVAFDPDSSGTKMQWLVIYPVAVGGANGNKQNPSQVEFYYNQTSLSSPATDGSHYQLNPTWLNGSGPGSSNAPCSTPGTTCIQSDLEGAAWSMELALPINGPLGDPSTGLIIPPTGHFGMYIDVLRVVSGKQWAQAPWPSGAAISGCASNATCYPNTSIPATGSGKPSGWGNGTIDPSPSPACNGVFIGSQNLDISVTNSTFSGSDFIDASNPNVFNANVHNTGVTASNVGVTFFIANFGLPGSEWKQVALAPAPPNFGTATIPPGGTTLSSNNWTPTASEKANYVSYPHQCILATLSSNPPTTTFFTNYSAVQNATVFDASRVERPVEVNSKGYAVNSQHNTEQEFDIVMKTKQTVTDSCSDSYVGAANRDANNQSRKPNCTPVSQLVQTAEACRHTGTYLTNKDKNQVELCQPVGSFSFIAHHPGPVENWTQQLTGPGLGKPDNNGVYHLRMANNTVVRLTNVIEANAGTGGGTTCGHLFGTAVVPLLFGGMIVIGLMLYRPRKSRNTEEQE
jgi:hypothetical protein